MSTIFANGFDFDTDDEVLKKHFGSVGEIKEFHFQSRGAAVITYEKASAASRAVDELHETTINGQSRYVVVKLDEHRSSYKGKGKGSGETKPPLRGKGGSKASGRTIFVTGFDLDTDDATLEKHFVKMGAIEDYHFQSKWSAVITYVKASAAERAVTELDESTMKDQSRYVSVKMDDPDRNGKGAGKASGKGKGKGKGKGGKGKTWRESGGEDTGRAIYVSGFDYDTDEATLETHFGDVGTIEELYFQSKGAAVITFSEEAAAQRALTELADTTMSGQTRYVSVKMDNAAHRNGKARGKGKW